MLGSLAHSSGIRFRKTKLRRMQTPASLRRRHVDSVRAVSLPCYRKLVSLHSYEESHQTSLCMHNMMWVVEKRRPFSTGIKISKKTGVSGRFSACDPHHHVVAQLETSSLLTFFFFFFPLALQNGKHGIFASGSAHPRPEEDAAPPGDSRRIACKKCGDFHLWAQAPRSKSRARWCQVALLAAPPLLLLSRVERRAELF